MANITETRKYQFGAGTGDIINESAAISQMWARNKLRNNLVELDRRTRTQFNAIVGVENPAGERIAAINAEIATLRTRMKLLRIPKPEDKPKRRKQGSMVPNSNKAEHERLSASIIALKKERGDLGPVSKAAKLANRTKFRDEITQLNAERYAQVRALAKRAMEGYSDVDPHSGNAVTVPALHECNAEEISDQHNTERVRAMKEGTELRFHSFIGEGRIVQRIHARRDFTGGEGKERERKFDRIMAQIEAYKAERKEAVQDKTAQQKKELSKQYKAIFERLRAEAEAIAPLRIGISEQELFAGKSKAFRMNPVGLDRDASNPTVWDKTILRAERRRRMQTVAHVRIGRDEYVSVNILLHRPFPIGARIIYAAVNRRKIGSKFRWDVEYTVKFPHKAVPSGLGVIALDLGWAQDSLPDGDGRIRVCGALERASDGNESFHEIALPPAYDSAIKKYRSIQSIIDQHTNEAFAGLTATSTMSGCSTELRSLLERAEQSRKQRAEHPPVGHLRRATWMVRKGEQVSEEVKTILEKWYQRYMHLSEWLAHGRDNVQAFRNDFYRRTAYELAQRNRVLLLDPDNFAKMAKTPEVEADAKPIAGDRRTAVAPSVLRNYLEEEFGSNVLWASGLWSSRTCSACNHINEKLGSARMFICAACGLTMDRERNATTNIMNAYFNQPGQFSTSKNVAAKLVEAKESEAMDEEALVVLNDSNSR